MAAKFIKSATELTGCPASSLPEVGFVGRSNAGKSSIINALAKQKHLARVSQAPGKTDVLNFYEFDDKFMLVDMPGYGYASRGQQARDSWTPMIENYLQGRQQLKGVVLVMDVQRPWSEDEFNLVNWLREYDLPVILVLNKVDKLNQKEKAQKNREFASIDSVAAIVFTSADKKIGVDELNRAIFNNFFKS